jgi:hypothetical protein
MNETGNEPQSRPADNADQIEDLRRQVNLLFGALIVASFTLTAFLGLQARRTSMDAVVVQNAADQTVKTMQQDDAAIEAGFARLKEFARTHPDFDKQVLSKFHHNTNSPAAVPPKK